jgi:hypothetical protein
MDGIPVAAADVLVRDHDGSRASECHSRGLMSWQQALPTYHGTLALQPNPTSYCWLQPGWPTFSAQPEQAQAQVEKEQQVVEAGMELVKEQVVELVMQLVQETRQQGRQVRAQGSVIFPPELQRVRREILPRTGHNRLYGVPQQAARMQGEPPLWEQPKGWEMLFAPVREQGCPQREGLAARSRAKGEVQPAAEEMQKPVQLQ